MIRISGIAIALTLLITTGSFKTPQPAGPAEHHAASIINTVKTGMPELSVAENLVRTAANPAVPQHFSGLERELDRYREIESRGGWEKIPQVKKHFWKGQSDPIIAGVKKRLAATGDYNKKDDSPLFSEELVEAVKKAQRQFGLKDDGSINLELVKELNIPAEKRVEQLRVNLERLKQTSTPSSGTHLVANIPEFRLHVYESGRHVFDMAIVVGKQATKTVAFSDQMKQIVFSPYWNVPPSIVRNEILPAMRKNPNYLRRNNYERVGTENGLPKIRQKPGPRNSLGKVKFLFPNSYHIYFHDTPAKSLFQLRKRAFSHGCIRLEQPARLAEYLLRNSSQWTPERIAKAMNAGKEQWVTLSSPVPVSIVYLTSWVDHNGLLHFREDIYGHDRNMARRIAKAA